MSLMTEQHISAQEWTCDICGGHDPKSCGCAGATATSREIQAAKREASRQRMIRSREKAKENKDRVARNAPVENPDESAPAVEDDDFDFLDKSPDPAGTARLHPEVRLRGFWYRVLKAKDYAEMDDMKGIACTQEMLEAMIAVPSAWIKQLGAQADSLKDLACTKEMLEVDAMISALTKLRKQMDKMDVGP